MMSKPLVAREPASKTTAYHKGPGDPQMDATEEWNDSRGREGEVGGAPRERDGDGEPDERDVSCVWG